MADRRLQVFHAVAKQRSFTRAAEALFMTQPAVTFQIRQLEEQYRIRLFERRTGDVALTPAGELVFSYAERILALNDELDTRLGELSGEVSGQLLIGASTTLGETLLPQLLGEFDALYPRVRSRLIVGNSEMIASRVAERMLDVGVIDMESALPGLASTVCGEDELLVICAPDHPLAALRLHGPPGVVGLRGQPHVLGRVVRVADDARVVVRCATHMTELELFEPDDLLAPPRQPVRGRRTEAPQADDGHIRTLRHLCHAPTLL